MQLLHHNPLKAIDDYEATIADKATVHARATKRAHILYYTSSLKEDIGAPAMDSVDSSTPTNVNQNQIQT